MEQLCRRMPRNFIPIPAKVKKLGLLSIYKFSLVSNIKDIPNICQVSILLCLSPRSVSPSIWSHIGTDMQFSLGQFCSFRFDLAMFWNNLVRFASILFGVGLNHIVFSSFLPFLGQILFCFDFARMETKLVYFRFVPAED